VRRTPGFDAWLLALMGGECQQRASMSHPAGRQGRGRHGQRLARPARPASGPGVVAQGGFRAAARAPRRADLGADGPGSVPHPAGRHPAAAAPEGSPQPGWFPSRGQSSPWPGRALPLPPGDPGRRPFCRQARDAPRGPDPASAAGSHRAAPAACARALRGRAGRVSKRAGRRLGPRLLQAPPGPPVPRPAGTLASPACAPRRPASRVRRPGPRLGCLRAISGASRMGLQPSSPVRHASGRCPLRRRLCRLRPLSGARPARPGGCGVGDVPAVTRPGAPSAGFRRLHRHRARSRPSAPFG